MAVADVETNVSRALLNFTSRRRDESIPLVSVVVPVYNEEGCLEQLHARLTQVLSQLGDEYEIIFVNDGSRDRSLDVVRELSKSDRRIGYQSFSRNFGHEAATTCGLSQAVGQTVVIIDADLQDPPEVIPAMLDQWRKGYDLIYARRRQRADESWLTKLTSHLFYRVFKQLARVDMPVDTGDFRLMDQAVVTAFNRLPERTRFVRGMISWTGFRQSSVTYDRDGRLAGETKYNFVKRLALSFDAICGMSTQPLRYITLLGLTMTAITFLVALAVLIHKLCFGLELPGYAMLTCGMFLLGGMQMLTLGILGEYIGRIYTEAQARPLYIIAESHLPRSLRTRDAVNAKFAV